MDHYRLQVQGYMDQEDSNRSDRGSELDFLLRKDTPARSPPDPC